MKTLNIKSVFYNFGEVSYTDKIFIGRLISEDLENNVINYFDGNKELSTKIIDNRLYTSDDFSIS